MRIVEGADDHLLRTSRCEPIGHVGEKRRVPARVIGHVSTVHPYAGLVVNRTKPEQQPLARAQRRRIECAPVSAGAVETGIADTAGG
jgi:hypothetical protein